MNIKPELVAPAGDFEKLQMAIAYGADAVYIGGKEFSLRVNAKNFDETELFAAVRYAHERNVKVYVSANIYAYNEDIALIEPFLRMVKESGADAVIVADPGVFDIARRIGLNVHISTQANVTNVQSAMFYKKLDARRVVLARELSLAEISEINQHCKSDDFDLEVFVHGSMCMSYSGRCMLSNYLTGRDANRGDCTHSCRWKYHVVEEERPGEYMPVYQDERGTYIFNSKDLCMIEYIPELIATGVSALKIEGRAKSAHYVAAATKIYRQALDDYFESEGLYLSKKSYYLNELIKISTRDFYTGFYFGRQTNGENAASESRGATQDFVGVVVDYDNAQQYAIIEQRNKFSTGDAVEFLKSNFSQNIDEIIDADGMIIKCAQRVKQLVRIKTERPVEKFDIVRKLRV